MYLLLGGDPAAAVAAIVAELKVQVEIDGQHLDLERQVSGT